MPKTKPVENPSVVESIGVSYDNGTVFDEATLTIKNAALFAPPFDAASGNYRSNRGNPYARTAFKSIAEAADGAMGWMFHPDLNEAGEREIRKTSDAALKITRTSVIEQAGSTAVRGDVKFIGKDKIGNFEVSSEGRHHLGFSVYIPRPLRNRDGVIEGVDTKFKRPLSVDLVEASSATKDITESTTDKPEQETPDMDKEAIQAIVNEALASQKKDILESIKGDLDAGRTAKAEADGLKRSQLVESRLSEKKVGAEYRTKALVGQLAVCESAESMDAIIDDYKSTLAKLINPVIESGATTKAGTRSEIIESVQERGLSGVLESMFTGVGSEGSRNAQLKAKFAKAFPRLSDANAKDEKTREMRRSVIESWSPKQTWEICTGLPASKITDQSVIEAAIDTSGFTNINANLLGAVVIEAYDIASQGFVAKDLATPYPSMLKTETFAGYTSATGVTNVSEGVAYPDITMSEKYVGQPTLVKYGGRVLITREEVMFDQKGLVVMRANRVADALAYDAENRRINQIIDANTVTYYPSNSATGLYVAAVTQSANPMDGSYLPLETAALKLNSITDDNSRRLAANARKPYTILIPSSLEFKAWHAVNATGTQLRANANANIVQGGNPFAGSTVLSSVILDAIDPNTWYIAGARGFQTQFINKQNIPFECVQLPQAEVQGVSQDIVGGIRCAIMEMILALDYRYVVKCTAT